MAYDEALADRVRDVVGVRDGVVEKKMFGGVAWMVHGNMACAIVGDELLVRLSSEDYETALTEPGVRQFDMTGRPMRAFVCVGGAAIASDDGLAKWVDAGADYASSLPPK
ncbi:MAG TPA: TfoX/Sxy family protein [Solirubrobacteraceae bacterium]